MIFSPELAAKVLDGAKTVTRRLLPARYQSGKVYAVQPGRGQRHVGHIKVTGVRTEIVAWISAADVRREGFNYFLDFRDYWTEIHGAWKPLETVVVIDFELADRCPDCQPLEPAP